MPGLARTRSGYPGIPPSTRAPRSGLAGWRVTNAWIPGYPAIPPRRHARTCSGHLPQQDPPDPKKPWMPGTSPGMTAREHGRSENHPETKTGFRETLILKRDSPGLSGISGIPRASIPFEKLPSARPMFPHRAPCARGLTNVMAGLVRTCSGYPGIHEALGLASPDHSPVMPGLVPGIFFRQTRQSGRSRGWPERESGHDAVGAWAGRRASPTTD